MQCSAVQWIYCVCLSVCLSRVSNFSSPCGLFTSDFARCLLDTLVRVSACTSPLTRVPRTLTRTRSRWWSLSTTLRVFAPGQSVGRVSHSRVRVFRAEVYIRIGIQRPGRRVSTVTSRSRQGRNRVHLLFFPVAYEQQLFSMSGSGSCTTDRPPPSLPRGGRWLLS